MSAPCYFSFKKNHHWIQAIDKIRSYSENFCSRFLVKQAVNGGGGNLLKMYSKINRHGLPAFPETWTFLWNNAALLEFVFVMSLETSLKKEHKMEEAAPQETTCQNIRHMRGGSSGQAKSSLRAGAAIQGSSKLLKFWAGSWKWAFVADPLRVWPLAHWLQNWFHFIVGFVLTYIGSYYHAQGFFLNLYTITINLGVSFGRSKWSPRRCFIQEEEASYLFT